MKNEVEFQLNLHCIPYAKLEGDIYFITIENKPESMTWPKWQLILKYVARHNQKNKCICGKPLRNQGELHHALFTRGDVQNNKFNYMIHDLYNVIVLCPECHDEITRSKSARFLVDIYGYNEIKNFYNNFPMRTSKINFDYYLTEMETQT